ncbi:MAG: beta-lactamase family protein [Bryobacteraceae bacterium]|nr:beta-lactamase family protein [Bryobacteraceae bacterium]
MRACFAVALLLPVPALPQAAAPARDLTRAIAVIDALAARELARTGIGSVTIGVISGPDLVWTKSYGLADVAAAKAAGKDSVYRIGSITKQLTGLMLLQMAERGKVRFSDPVGKYLPEVNNIAGRWTTAPPITLVQLAVHTSGLDREPGDMATYTSGPVGRWERIMLAALPRTRFLHEPGTRYSYSNIGYAILGAALARAAGSSYIDYMTRNILEPLKMTRTVFEQNASMLPALAKGYAIRDGQPDPAPAATELETGRGYKIPNGALFTTVSDLARFISFELGQGPDSMLPRQVWLDNLTRSASANGDLTSGYGVGFQVMRRGDLIVRGHGGSVAGYHAGAYFHVPSQTGLIFLRNAAAPDFRADFVFAAFAALSQD